MSGSLGIDVRLALRGLIRDKSNVTAILSIALAGAACTAIFGLVHGALLRPLPYPDPGRLVSVRLNSEKRDAGGLVPPTLFDEWEATAKSFESLAACVAGPEVRFDLGTARGAVKVPGAVVTTAFFATLGVQPRLGRVFTEAEQTPDGPLSVILSDDLWRSLGARSELEGFTVRLSGRLYDVVGVLPARFSFPNGTEIWLPRPAETHKALNLGFDIHPYYAVLGRLKNGVGLDQAEQELSSITRGVQGPFSGSAPQAAVSLLSDELTRRVRSALWALLGAVVSVLLIACSNVVSLRLAQVHARSPQTALAAALGAGRARLALRPLLEGFFLVGAASLIGAAILVFLIPILGLLIPPQFRIGAPPVVDRTFLAFSVMLPISITLAIGLAPAVQASRPDLISLLRAGGRMVGSSGRVAKLLVTAQVGLALVLLVGAALLIQSLVLFTHMRTGFAPEGAVTLTIAPPAWKYRDGASRSRLYESLVSVFEALPGTTAAGAVSLFPLGGRFPTLVEATPEGQAPRQVTADWLSVTPGYFSALGVPLELGRDFDASDGASEPAVIVDRSVARAIWSGEPPLGKSLSLLGCDWRVVGVAGPILYRGFGAKETPQVYIPQRESPIEWPSMTFVIRTSGGGPSLAAEIRQAVAEFDRDLAVDEVRTLQDRVDESFSNSRFATLLLTGFAGFGLLLASMGIYGVLAGFVSRGSAEIGVRMALGASRRDILRLVLGRSMRIAVTGLVLGHLAAGSLARLIEALLFGVEPLDTTAYLGATIVVLGVAGLASYAPIRRALAVDPATVLRSN